MATFDHGTFVPPKASAMQRLSDDTESKACAERLAKEFCDFVCSFCKDIGWK